MMSRAAREPGRPKQEKQSEQRSQERAGSETGRGKGKKLYSKSQETYGFKDTMERVNHVQSHKKHWP